MGGCPEGVLAVFGAGVGRFDERDGRSLELPGGGVGLDELPIGLLVALEE